MKVYTSKGFIVADYKIMRYELTAPASKTLMPSLAYTFTSDINLATIFESYDGAMTAFRNAKFKRDLDFKDIIK